MWSKLYQHLATLPCAVVFNANRTRSIQAWLKTTPMSVRQRRTAVLDSAVHVDNVNANPPRLASYSYIPSARSLSLA